MADRELLGENIVEHLRIYKEAGWATRSYWYHSKLWDAIREYLGKNEKAAKEKCALMDKPTVGYGKEKKIADVRWYKGTGPSVQLKEVSLGGPEGNECFHMKIEVEFCTDPEDPYYVDYPRDCGNDKTIRLDVPVELELEFSKAKFKGWLKEEWEKRSEAREEKEKKELRELIKKYPETASEVLLAKTE